MKTDLASDLNNVSNLCVSNEYVEPIVQNHQITDAPVWSSIKLRRALYQIRRFSDEHLQQFT